MIKNNQPRISVIIPVYNEKNTILEIIKKVKDVPISKEIIIIDDFSKDGTREILKKIKDCEINIFFHERNYGKGHALRTGIEHAKGKINPTY